VPVRVVLEDVLDLGASDLAVLNLDDVEPARVVLSFIELKHKVLIEYVPAHDIIYLNSLLFERLFIEYNTK